VVCESASADFGEVVEWARAHFLFEQSVVSFQPSAKPFDGGTQAVLLSADG
jgi:hypothetical protein